VLHAVFPLASIFASIRVYVGSITVLFVVLILTFIATSVLPDVESIAMHDAFLEVSLKIATIRPGKATVARHLVVRPGTTVSASIVPEVASLALFDAHAEVTMIVAAVAPNLNPLPILFVLCRARVFRILELNRLDVCLNVEALILSENTEIGLAVHLPETFISV